jgi:hypothetical protein
MSSCLAGMASTTPPPSVTSACPNDGQSTHIASWSTFEVSGGPLPQLRWLDTVGGAHMPGVDGVSSTSACTVTNPTTEPCCSFHANGGARFASSACQSLPDPLFGVDRAVVTTPCVVGRRGRIRGIALWLLSCSGPVVDVPCIDWDGVAVDEAG